MTPLSKNWIGDTSGKSGQSWYAKLLDRTSKSKSKLARPYEQSGWVMRAIKTIAGPIAAVPLQFTSDRLGGMAKVTDPRLEALWTEPAKDLSLHDFLEATVSWLKLNGNAFWLLGDQTLVPFPEARSPGAALPLMIVARPDMMRPVKVGGVLTGWAYTDGGGKVHALLPEQVIQTKFWNPYDEILGLSEYCGVEIPAEADHFAGTFERNLFRGNGDRGAFISMPAGTMLSDPQQQQIIAQLREKQDAAARGDIKLAFIPSDIKVQDPMIQTVDAAYLASRAGNRHDIFTILGVPPSMTEVMASYSIGSASDYYRLIQNTCIPLSAKIAASIQKVSNRITGQRVFAQFDWEDHPVMQTVRNEKTDLATKYFDRGMSWDIISEHLRLKLPKFPGSDKGYLPVALVPIDEAIDPANDPAMDEDPLDIEADLEAGEDLLDEVKATLLADSKAEQSEIAAKQAARDPRELALWKTHMLARKPTEKLLANRFKRLLMTARAQALQRVAAHKIDTLIETKAPTAPDFNFDKIAFERALTQGMADGISQAIGKAGSETLREVDSPLSFAPPPPEVADFLRVRQNLLKGVADDVWQRVRGAIETSMQQGEGIDGIAKSIRQEFNAIAEGRSTVIAQTEAQAAFSFARQAGLEQAGVKYKKWLSAADNKVRATHLEANGEVVPIDEKFTVGGEELDHPGDIAGSPGNVINCRCVLIAARTENG